VGRVFVHVSALAKVQSLQGIGYECADGERSQHADKRCAVDVHAIHQKDEQSDEGLLVLEVSQPDEWDGDENDPDTEDTTAAAESPEKNESPEPLDRLRDGRS
jgi:hypothetical protein